MKADRTDYETLSRTSVYCHRGFLGRTLLIREVKESEDASLAFSTFLSPAALVSHPSFLLYHFSSSA
jgi:hypothetical protein